MRVHPFELVFAEFRARHLPAIGAELGSRVDLDAFMLARSAIELMAELRPDDGFGDAVDDFVALVHAAYLFWRDGEQTIRLDAAATEALCGPASGDDVSASRFARQPVRYAQIAPQLVWARVAGAGPLEPLDGWFAVPVSAGLRVVACLGVHAERPGLSVVAVQGPPPANVARADGTPLFAPTMPGGERAGLHAISAPEELLLLGVRGFQFEESSRWP